MGGPWGPYEPLDRMGGGGPPCPPPDFGTFFIIVPLFRVQTNLLDISIDLSEWVQRGFTKRLERLWNVNYAECLRSLHVL